VRAWRSASPPPAASASSGHARRPFRGRPIFVGQFAEFIAGHRARRSWLPRRLPRCAGIPRRGRGAAVAPGSPEAPPGLGRRACLKPELAVPAAAFRCLALTRTAFRRRGIRECARALAPGGALVLTDQFSRLLWPTMLGSRRGKARTRSRAADLITAAGPRDPQCHPCYAVIIQSVTAVKQKVTRPTPLPGPARAASPCLRPAVLSWQDQPQPAHGSAGARGDSAGPPDLSARRPTTRRPTTRRVASRAAGMR
jgi:hypothetical protein